MAGLASSPGAADRLLADGWVLTGADGGGRPIRLVFSAQELSQAYLGIAIGRHPALCERVIDDASVSRRHARIGITEGRLFIEDLNSLNGTYVDDQEAARFEQITLGSGQAVTLGRITLELARLDES